MALKKIIHRVTLVALFLLLVFGGLGISRNELLSWTPIFIVCVLLTVFLLKDIIKFPPGSILYAAFLTLFIFSFLWSANVKKSLEAFFLFLTGGLFWLVFYNLKEEFLAYFDKIVIILGLVFGLLFLLNYAGDKTFVSPWSLHLSYSGFQNHYNIGDFWAVVLTVLFYHLIGKGKKAWWAWVLTSLGVYFLFMSQSRSAFVALLVGVFYVLERSKEQRVSKKIFYIFTALVALLFILAGATKPTLFARPYFVQALLGLIRKPWGVGVGNFNVVSLNPQNWISGLADFSTVVHNVFLEILTGMGILGVIFLFWFIKVAIGLWKSRSYETLVYEASFFALTANFFFHSSYFIPTMLWLWFASLGLSQKSSRATFLQRR